MLKFIILLAIFQAVLGAPSEKLSLNDVSINHSIGIVGGTPADISQFPWQVSVQYLNEHYCGGVLIAPNWVLTAAHCLVEGSTNNLNIRAGSTSKSSGGVTATVSRFIIHPNYSHPTGDSDITLLKLANNINVANAQPARLPKDGQTNADGATLTVTGWGAISEDGTGTENLVQVSIPIINQAKCISMYAAIRRVTDNMFCAGLLNEGGKDTCPGDSGGPAVVNGEVVGLVSWGLGCGRTEYSGVYTKVSNFRSWITQNTGV